MPVPFSIKIGQRFTRLIVEAFFGLNRHGSHVWKCRCTCGTVTYVRASDLRAGKSRSCGCLSWRHGMRHTPEYKAWQAIKDRCYRAKNKAFKNYGGRGIQMCERWFKSFQAFYEDVGPRPSPQHSIERIQNEHHYEPGNVKWATRAEQMRNRRANTYLTLNGVTMCLVDWCAQVNKRPSTVCERLKAGWSVEDALTRPTQPRRARNH